MSKVLNRSVAEQKNAFINKATQNGIVHFGVGGFHRSHQAYTFQLLIEKYPALANDWSICGVGIMPNDIHLINAIKKQDYLYSLKMSDHLGNAEIKIISVINELLFGPENPTAVIEKIAAPTTKIVSFTITEGGYNINEKTGVFNLDNPAIKSDLNPKNQPTTVFGYIARGIALRKEKNLPAFTLLSCDNVQENGEVLEKAVVSFLQAYDDSLVEYVKSHVSFPNSMVDRITPFTTTADKDLFEQQEGYRDEALVVSEKFFQWVIEKKALKDFPAIENVGVEIVDEVRPYEKMKLRILNGGHSLVGLIGKALGYDYIHDAVVDKDIDQLFFQYDIHEVIPSLDPIPGVDFVNYYQLIKERFSNKMINDSTNRIISQSTAKIPKFILPVLEDQLNKGSIPQYGILVLAAWWWYLDQHYKNGSLDSIEDDAKAQWKSLFDESNGDTFSAFIQNHSVMQELSNSTSLVSHLKEITTKIKNEGMRSVCASFVKNSAE